jgi:hypothetical protein
MVLSGCVVHEVVGVQYVTVFLFVFYGCWVITARSKHVEETAVVHDNVAHHQSTNRTRSYASMTACAN